MSLFDGHDRPIDRGCDHRAETVKIMDFLVKKLIDGGFPALAKHRSEFQAFANCFFSGVRQGELRRRIPEATLLRRLALPSAA